MRYNDVAAWENTKNYSTLPGDRDEKYEMFKDERSALLLNKVFERLPELKGNIISMKAATPLTYRDYINSPDGSLYGIMKDVNKTGETEIATRSRIRNLFMTGQNVNLHGVLGVSLTAVHTCAALLGMDYLLDKIKK